MDEEGLGLESPRKVEQSMKKLCSYNPGGAKFLLFSALVGLETTTSCGDHSAPRGQSGQTLFNIPKILPNPPDQTSGIQEEPERGRRTMGISKPYLCTSLVVMMELTLLPSPCGAGSLPEAPRLGNQQAHLGSLGTDCYLGSAPGERIPRSRPSVPVSQQ